MSLFGWKAEYSVGCVEIDAQHEKLFHLAAQLHRALVDGRPSDVLAGLLKRLADYTGHHFATEERLMQETGYPNLLPHRIEHVQLMGRMGEYRNRIANGEDAVTVELVEFLSDWFKHHFGKCDLKLGSHLRTRYAFCTVRAPAPASPRSILAGWSETQTLSRGSTLVS